MAAVGIIRTKAWVPLERGDSEALTLETVKLAVELGADLNVANTDGRTALDAANALRYKGVADYLVAQGAKPGTGGSSSGRGGAGGRGAATGRGAGR